MENYSKKLFSYLSKERKDIFNISLYAILGGLASLSVPLGIQAIVSYAFGATMVTSIYLLIAFVTLVTWLSGFFQLRVMEIIEKLQQKIFVEYSFAFAEKLPKIDLSYANQYYLPELMNRFFDTQNLQKGISKILLELPVAIIQIFFGLTLLSFYHPYFIGFAIVVLSGVAFIFYFTKDMGTKTSIEESDQKYEIAAWLEDIARDIKSFKTNAFLQTNVEETDRKLIKYLNFRTSHFKILRFQYKTIIFFKVMITLFMLLLGTYLLIDQKLNIGAFVATEIVVLTIMTAVEKLIKNLEKYYDIVTSFAKLSKVLDLKEEAEGILQVDEASDGFEIETENVKFGYDDASPLLNGINTHFPKNDISLIYGKQGSGKSVLMNLLAGLYQPLSGKILLNKHPIENYKKTDLRKNIGLYLDDLDVVKGNIIQNINLGNTEFSAEKIVDFAKKLGIENFASYFKDGLLTTIQASDKSVSYSTKKIILLIRAFIGSKRLLILEDPLEGFNENIKMHMLSYIKELSSSRTIIIVGDKLNYQDIANLIFELNEGTLVSKK